MADLILLVDDEATMINTHARMLNPLVSKAGADATDADQPALTLHKCGSGAEAEEFLLQHPHCAVVVSDLRMPGMDGLALLERVRVIAPDAVRIILTGNADVHSAIEAINRASIFRLLTKPCNGQALCTAVTDALKQHQLVIAERQLLEQTLRGSVQVLVEILTLVDPVGSSRALRIHRYVRHIIRGLGLQDAWALEVAAMLSHLGSLTMAAPGQDAAAVEAAPSSGEGANQASIGYELLKNIPRLDAVAGIIARQQDPLDPADAKVPLADRDAARRGGQVLRVAIEFDSAVVSGTARGVVLNRMRQRTAELDQQIVDSLADVELPELIFEPRMEPMLALRVGMILDEDLRNPHGLLIMPSGQEITRPVLLRLKSLGEQDPRKRVRVLAPRMGGDAPPARPRP